MRLDRHRLARIAQSVFDQAWLSGINFAISLLLIRTLDKSEYGLYVLLFNTVLLFLSLAGALLSSPFVTLLPQQAEEQRPIVIRVFAVLTLVFALAAALAGFGGLLAYGRWSADPLLGLAAGLGFSLGVFGSIYRDNIRALQYTLGNPGQALRNNLAYGLLLLAGVGVAVWQDRLSATTVLLISGGAGTVVSGVLLQPVWQALRHDVRAAWRRDGADRACARKFWDCGRWALLGALMTFIASNTYPYLVALSFTKSDVADLAASRLLTLPIAMLAMAWTNLARPTISRLAHEQHHDRLDALIRRSIALAALLTGGMALALWIGSDLIPRLFGDKYAALLPLTLLWTVQTGLAFIRGVFGSALMTSNTGYRQLSRIAAINLVAMVILMAGATRLGQPEAIVVALAVLEILQCLLIERVRRSQRDTRLSSSADETRPVVT